MLGKLPPVDKEDFLPAKELIIGYNIGAGLDIPNAVWVKGVNGNTVMSGGAYHIMAIAGEGNTFKTTVSHYGMLTVSARYNSGDQMVLDTELIYDSNRQTKLAASIPEWGGINPSYLDDESRVGSARIRVLDGTMHLGEFYDKLHDHVYDVKMKAGKSSKGTTPFLDRDGKPIIAQFPTGIGMDSISSVRVKQQDKMLEEHEVGDSKTNTYDLTGGRIKAQFLSDIIPLTSKGNLLMWITAHVGKKFDMTGRGMLVKDMAFMAPDEKLSRCPDRLNFYSNILYHFRKCAPMYNSSSDKTPKYSKNKNDRFRDNTDLMELYGVAVRCKRGVSGIPFKMAASQTDGVLGPLTEFHTFNASEIHKKYGIGDPNSRSSYLELLPETKYMRTTVRELLVQDHAFRVATTITCEIYQMFTYWHDERVFQLVEPKELYRKLTADGWDLPWLFSIAHTFWVHAEDNCPWYELSTMDVINMYHGTYHPYWLEADKKTIKPEWRKRKEKDAADRKAVVEAIDNYIAKTGAV